MVEWLNAVVTRCDLPGRFFISNYCMNFKVIRCKLISLNRTVADKGGNKKCWG